MLVRFQPRQPITPGGEIGSRLAYTQKSEGQNLPGRPAFALRASARLASQRPARRLGATKRGARRRLSDTGGPGLPAVAPSGGGSKTRRGSHFHFGLMIYD